MRRLILVLAALGLGLAGCGDDDAGAARPGLAKRELVAGDVTVTVRPVRIGVAGADFEVAFDTHTVDLDLDVARSARLVVDGTEWTSPRWEGAGPGGHHREGTLRFGAKGPATGRVVLTIDGLDRPATARWTLGSG